MSSDVVQQVRLLTVGCLLLGLAATLPIYLRATDGDVVKQAGRNTVSLVQSAKEQLRLERPAIAALLLEGGRQCQLEDLEPLRGSHQAFRSANPDLNLWGGDFPELDSFFVVNPHQEATVLEVFINQKTRASILSTLETSRRPGVQAILANRTLGRTQAFPPVHSPGGAAFDAVILATALLSQGDHLNSGFRIELERRASDANRGSPTHGLESLYLDVLSLCKTLNWAQFSGLMSRFESRDALRRLAHTLANHPEDLPRLFAICWLSPSVERVSQYLARFPESALEDLSEGLRSHSGGLKRILDRQERVFHSPLRSQMKALLPWPTGWNLIAQFGFLFPWTALLIKYLAILLGAFCLIRFLANLIPQRQLVPEIFQVEGLATIRQQILALCILGLTLLLGEPFLAQKGQTPDTPLNWKFPTAPAAVVERVDTMLGEKVDELTLLALVLFFVIQAVLYALCLVKLKEIEKQKGSSRLKLKLLDNEDNMFDAGLYVGLGGTVLSLLILTLNLAQVGLMAAYASTLFGIIFVSLLKIFHVRPVRRKFLIEAEAGIL